MNEKSRKFDDSTIQRAANTVAMLKRVCEDTPRPIQDVIPETPDWLCATIERLLEKRPADRYQTAKEVADLFARSQAELKLNGQVATSEREKELGTGKRIAFVARELNASTAKTTVSVNDSFRLSEFAHRHRTRLLSGGVLAILAILSFLFFPTRGH